MCWQRRAHWRRAHRQPQARVRRYEQDPLDDYYPEISTHTFTHTHTHTVIHFTLAGALADELPALLTSKAPATASNRTIGTGNYAAPPQALLLGAGFAQADISALRALAEGTPGAVQIPWLWIDASKGDAPAGQPTEEEIRAIGAKVAQRMKETLETLRAEGKLGDGHSGVHMV